MKKIRRLRSGLSPVMILCTLFFLSCAHESRTSGDGGGLFADMNNKGDSAPSESESKPEEEAVASEPKPSDLDASAADIAKPVGDDLAATATNKDFEIPGSSQTPPATNQSPATDTALMTPADGSEPKADNTNQPELLASNPASVPVPDATPSETPAPANEVPALLPETTAAEAKTEVAPTPVVVEAKAAEVLPLPETTPAPAPEVKFEEVDTKPSAQEVTVASNIEVKPVKTRASVPQIPQAPSRTVLRKGATLNRFYILRTGDSPESVATLIYGSEDRASNLVAWNPKAWKTGSLVLYVAPTQPNDSQMKSYYEDRGLQAEQYVVKPGDWLSTIAKNSYGDAKSWKEIAILNHLASPNQIAPGTTLNLYPGSSSARETASNQDIPKNWVPEKLAANDKSKAVEAKLTAPEVPVSASVPLASAAQPTPVIEHANDVASSQDPMLPGPKHLENRKVKELKAKAEPHLASGEVGNFFYNHAMETLGLGVIVFLAFVMRRLRRENEEVEMEE